MSSKKKFESSHSIHSETFPSSPVPQCSKPADLAPAVCGDGSNLYGSGPPWSWLTENPSGEKFSTSNYISVAKLFVLLHESQKIWLICQLISHVGVHFCVHVLWW